jgi:hypothetical protein
VSVATESGPHALPGSIAALEARGFQGFRVVAALHADRCLEVPVTPGVYAMARESLAEPEFLAKSVGGWYRGKDPSATRLEEQWVPGAQVLYYGRAVGPGVRSLLQQRVKRYLRLGHGKRVAHWGGRLVWQLADHEALLVAWLPTPEQDPAALQAELVREFFAHHARLPFANLPEEDAREDAEERGEEHAEEDVT